MRQLTQEVNSVDIKLAEAKNAWIMTLPDVGDTYTYMCMQFCGHLVISMPLTENWKIAITLSVRAGKKSNTLMLQTTSYGR